MMSMRVNASEVESNHRGVSFRKVSDPAANNAHLFSGRARGPVLKSSASLVPDVYFRRCDHGFTRPFRHDPDNH